jgi:hypothetical protein
VSARNRVECSPAGLYVYRLYVRGGLFAGNRTHSEDSANTASGRVGLGVVPQGAVSALCADGVRPSPGTVF